MFLVPQVALHQTLEGGRGITQPKGYPGHLKHANWGCKWHLLSVCIPVNDSSILGKGKDYR